ncbi:putative E3 ubiquitin-protein ligase rha4a [Turnera subulata]|uniref:RING-type E3 ubiquitin transferase n=1 Tax=Turnera subulata TaxID=218843 RepID=A0A9Q0JBD0_9ROSI|nr:putative E3 ubiquitin-protein ligase rha4a [Turnera subulata]
MGFPPPPSPPHLYPQELQLKLYQAFIFSIPILFSIILFLLFYLFYLKRRASALSSSPQILPRSANHPTSYVSSVCEIVLKEDVKEKLPIVLFDEELRTKESQCCVCLGDFEIKEELLQIPSCKHVFHIECIHHWLHSNSTCPLCRCFVIFSATKLDNPAQHSGQVLPQLHTTNSNHFPLNLSPEQQYHHHNHQHPHQEQEQQDIETSTGQRPVPIEGSSGATSMLMDSILLPESSLTDHGSSSANQESFLVHIQTDRG